MTIQCALGPGLCRKTCLQVMASRPPPRTSSCHDTSRAARNLVPAPEQAIALRILRSLATDQSLMHVPTSYASSAALNSVSVQSVSHCPQAPSRAKHATQSLPQCSPAYLPSLDFAHGRSQHVSEGATTSSTADHILCLPHIYAPNSSATTLLASPRRRLALSLLAVLDRAQKSHSSLRAPALADLVRHCVSTQDRRALPLLLAVTPAATAAQWRDLASNHCFLVGFWAWLFAQTLKIFTRRWKTGIWDVRAIADSGGMPSSHSALCTSVTTGLALEYGLGSPLFAMALCFTLIVMYDATGVRRHAGKQAEVLNVMLGEILEGHPIKATKLKEVLGHTPLQVAVGALLGVAVGCVFPQSSLVQMNA